MATMRFVSRFAYTKRMIFAAWWQGNSRHTQGQPACSSLRIVRVTAPPKPRMCDRSQDRAPVRERFPPCTVRATDETEWLLV